MTNRTETSFSYFVVMLSYPARYSDGIRISVAGREAIVDPEITRNEVISRVRSGEYAADEIVFIHYVTMNEVPQDVTEELKHCAKWGDHEERTFNRPDALDAQAAAFDHARDLRKHQVV